MTAEKGSRHQPSTHAYDAHYGGNDNWCRLPWPRDL